MWRFIIGVGILLAIIWLVIQFRNALKNSREFDKLDDEEKELERKKLLTLKRSKLRRKKANIYADEKMSDIDDALYKINLIDKREEK